jgi:hypothetical protein
MGENRGKKATVNIPDGSFSPPFLCLAIAYADIKSFLQF